MADTIEPGMRYRLQGGRYVRVLSITADAATARCEVTTDGGQRLFGPGGGIVAVPLSALHAGEALGVVNRGRAA